MSLKLLIFISAGGAIGAVGRYMLTVAATQWFGEPFPYGTMIVNIIGSFLLGVLLAAISLNWAPSIELRTFIQVGVLGAFTTFSTFSLDAYQLMAKGEYISSALYIGSTVIVGIVSLFIGIALVRQVFA